MTSKISTLSKYIKRIDECVIGKLYITSNQKIVCICAWTQSRQGEDYCKNMICLHHADSEVWIGNFVNFSSYLWYFLEEDQTVHVSNGDLDIDEDKEEHL